MSSVKIPSTPGQRWISEAEPELGLGLVEELDGRRVTMYFPAGDERRVYAADSAPLRRARFQAGDHIESTEGRKMTVASVSEDGELLVYSDYDGNSMLESELVATLGTAQVPDRLMAGLTDEDRWFELRRTALAKRREIDSSPVRGFSGGRIELIPHQLYIASEVARRMSPRVLLADEVGLGKTIEACLIMHRLLHAGRIQRVLVLVPDALVHQWFVELYRRFHLRFALVDAERCVDQTENPFVEEQLIICSVDWLATEPKRALQAVEAGWDLLIVDEAHHLAWSPRKPSVEYQMVDQLSKASDGLLLLTATPEQLGLQSHFARLRLLDPARYSSFKKFEEEQSHYRDAVKQADKLVMAGDKVALAELLDRHGPGRVMFRNTRQAITGFPERKVHAAEVDDKLDWLEEFLRSTDDKVLLILNGNEEVIRLEEALRQRIQTKAAMFHEKLTLIQRDRQAAWFAEPDGARLLLCSEIGGEGRNFQFCRHLILYDLPDNPERLEQRIGRLDRIGQKHTIEIYVPYLAGTREARLFDWLHNGLNAFETSLRGSQALLAEGGTVDKPRLKTAELRKRRDAMHKELDAGRDRLLELHSHDAEASQALVEQILKREKASQLEKFLFDLFDVFGVHAEDLGNRDWLLTATQTYADVFSGFQDEDGMRVTFHRDRALEREDVTFLSWDHPMVLEGLDALLGTDRGTTSVVQWAGEPGIYLQALFVIECPAPRRLQLHRYLPVTAVEVLLDLSGNEVSLKLPKAYDAEELGPVLQDNAALREVVPRLLTAATELAEPRVAKAVASARRSINKQLGQECTRLKSLAEVNPNVRPDEIAALESLQADCLAALGIASLRLDAVRLILRQ